MSLKTKLCRYTVRFFPCPYYDIIAVETWLEDMAAEGLFVYKIISAMDLAVFERREPMQVRFRLEVETDGFVKMLQDEKGPSEEQLELSKEFGWEYIAQYGQFYIFCNHDSGAREMNTDPAVQAMALDIAGKSHRPSWITIAFVFISVILNFVRERPLSFLASGGAFALSIYLFTIFLLAVWVWFIIHEYKIYRFYRKLQDALNNGEDWADEGMRRLSPYSSNWRKWPKWFIYRRMMVLMLILGMSAILIMFWNEESVYLPLGSYEGTLPFPTIQSFAGADGNDYIPNPYSEEPNPSVCEEASIVASQYTSYTELARVKTRDEKWIGGYLHVAYYEMRGSLLARILAWELYRDSKPGRWAALDASHLNADYAYMYLYYNEEPTMIIRKKNIVVMATFSQYEECEQIPEEVWSAVICDSV